MVKKRFTKKEKIMFWGGLVIGIIGGTIGSFWSSSYFDLINSNYQWTKIFGFIIWSLFFIGLILWINKIIRNQK